MVCAVRSAVSVCHLGVVEHLALQDSMAWDRSQYQDWDRVSNIIWRVQSLVHRKAKKKYTDDGVCSNHDGNGGTAATSVDFIDGRARFVVIFHLPTISILIRLYDSRCATSDVAFDRVDVNDSVNDSVNCARHNLGRNSLSFDFWFVVVANNYCLR